MYDSYLSYLAQLISILPKCFLQLVLTFPYKLSYPVLHMHCKLETASRTDVGTLTGVTRNSNDPLLKAWVEYYSPTPCCPSREKGIL